LNTDTQYMSGVKIANENTTNGASGEPSMLPPLWVERYTNNH
jgi:hypothetical protein